jgi:hypothetical protein
MKDVLTKRQTDTLRRLMIIAGQELITMANSECLPDKWDINLGLSSFTIAAKDAVWNEMIHNGMLPPRRK